MSKRDDLRSKMAPPPLKRTQVANDADVTEAMNQVVDGTTNSTEKKSSTSKPTAPNKKSLKAKNEQADKVTSKPAPAKAKQGRGVVTKGSSTRTTATKAEQEDEQSKEPVKRMTIDLPQSLHTKLKMESIRRRGSMKDYLIELIEKSLK